MAATREVRKNLVELGKRAQDSVFAQFDPEKPVVEAHICEKLDKNKHLCIKGMMEVASIMNARHISTTKEWVSGEDPQLLITQMKGSADQAVSKFGIDLCREREDGYALEIYRNCFRKDCSKKSKYCILFHADPYQILSNLSDYGPLSCLETIHIVNEEGRFRFKIFATVLKALKFEDSRPVLNEFQEGRLGTSLQEIKNESLDLGDVESKSIAKLRKEHKKEVKQMRKDGGIAEDDEEEEEEAEDDAEGQEAEREAEVELPPDLAQVHLIRHLQVTKLGRILNYEDKMRVEKSMEPFSEHEKIIREGNLVEHVLDNTASKMVFVDKEETVRVSYSEPNMQTILNDLIKVQGGSCETVVNKMVFMREVYLTIRSPEGTEKRHHFLEPVFTTFEPARKRRESVVGASEAAKSRKPPYVPIVFLSKCKKIPSISIINERYTNMNKVLGSIAEEQLITAGLLKFLPEESKSNVPLVFDRGAVIKFRYENEEITVEKEYRMKIGLLERVRTLKPVVEDKSALVRYCLENGKEKQVDKSKVSRSRMYSVEKVERDGITVRKKLARTLDGTTVTEELVEPCMTAVVEWMLQKMSTAKEFDSVGTKVNSPNINFMMEGTYRYEEKQDTGLWTVDFGRTKSKLIYVHVTKEKSTPYNSVKELLAGFKAIPHSAYANLYELTQDKSKITPVTDVSTKEAILKAVAGCDDFMGKEIIKMPLFSESGLFMNELELKSSVIEKKPSRASLVVTNSSSSCFAKGKYTDGFEEDVLAAVMRIRITPVSKIIDHLVAITPNKIVHVCEEEPNLLTIITSRGFANTSDTMLPVKYAPRSKLDVFKYLEKTGMSVHSRADASTPHEKQCPFFKNGSFAIRSRVQIKEKTVDDRCGFLYKVSTTEICSRDEIKLVCASCRSCKNAISLIQNCDTLSDGAPFTLPKQYISPIDINIATTLMVQQTQNCTEKTREKVLSRMKHRVQRAMNHSLKALPSEKTVDDDEEQFDDGAMEGADGYAAL